MLAAGYGDARLVREIGEPTVAEVRVERAVGLVGNEQVGQAVAVVISKVDRHARSGLAGVVERRAGLDRHFREPAAAVVSEQVVRHLVVGHIDILIPVVVVIGRRNTHRPPLFSNNTRGFRDVFKPAVTLIAIEHVGLPVKIEGPRKTVWGIVELVFGIESDVVADIEIQIAVVVVIQPDGPYAEYIATANPGCGCDILERAVTIIAVEHVLSIIGHIDIRIAVVVVVADRDAEPERSVADAGLFRHVDKPVVSQVFIEGVAGQGGRALATAELIGKRAVNNV